MSFVIPFTKDVKFNSNIAEIISISLEHDYTANADEVLGNFTISGEYKTHEVSVNKEQFEYVLPFSVNMTSKIETSSVDFEVEDFTYEIVDNDTLRVNIEYTIKAEKYKEDELDILLEEIERVDDINEPIEEQRDISDNAKETILNNINSDEEEVYVTYHVYEMKEEDTIKTVCTKYNVQESLLEEYNDLNTLTLGDKIIIPEINE